jgi:hypothetical protein
MTPKPNTQESGGTGMMLVISFATVFVVAAEGAFIAARPRVVRPA